MYDPTKDAEKLFDWLTDSDHSSERDAYIDIIKNFLSIAYSCGKIDCLEEM